MWVDYNTDFSQSFLSLHVTSLAKLILGQKYCHFFNKIIGSFNLVITDHKASFTYATN